MLNKLKFCISYLWSSVKAIGYWRLHVLCNSVLSREVSGRGKSSVSMFESQKTMTQYRRQKQCCSEGGKAHKGCSFAVISPPAEAPLHGSPQPASILGSGVSQKKAESAAAEGLNSETGNLRCPRLLYSLLVTKSGHVTIVQMI